MTKCRTRENGRAVTEMPKQHKEWHACFHPASQLLQKIQATVTYPPKYSNPRSKHDFLETP